MSQELKEAVGVLATDTSVTDIIPSGETRTPTGVMLLATYATALDNTTDESALSIGFSDFTVEAACTMNDEHGQNPTDSSRGHNGSNGIFYLDPGLTSTERLISVTAIAGGVRLTPGSSGTAFRVFALIIYESACFAGSAGDTVTAGSTFDFTHGLTNAPKCGLFAYTHAHEEGAAHGTISFGMFSWDGATIIQRSICVKSQTGQSDGENHGYLATNRVATAQDNGVLRLSEIELTIVDATKLQFTNVAGGNTLVGDLIGLIIEADELDAKVLSINSLNTDSSDWVVTGFGFKPQAVIMAMTNFTAEDTGVGDNELAGCLSIASFSDDAHSAGIASEQAANPSNTSSRLATDLYLQDHDGSADYQMDNPTFDSDGFTFAAADITIADTTTHKWFALGIKEAVSVVITDVDGDEEWNDGDTGLVITGTGFL